MFGYETEFERMTLSSTILILASFIFIYLNAASVIICKEQLELITQILNKHQPDLCASKKYKNLLFRKK